MAFIELVIELSIATALLWCMRGRIFDTALNLSIPVLIFCHLLAVPHTKVEESFNLQATHDILKYGYQVSPKYDHFEFPGAVERTFVGAAALATLSKPVIAYFGKRNSQFAVRLVLGAFNASALLFYKRCLGKAYGKGVARWYAALQATQFHVLYYASRTLPNSFAFALTTVAMGLFLPSPGASQSKVTRRNQVGIFLIVFGGVVFRAELALMLIPQFAFWFFHGEMTPKALLTTCITSAIFAIAISVPIDSYYWQKPVWPEFSSLIFNVWHGKSSEWGTLPWYTYFVIMLPKMLLNPVSTAFNLFANFYEPLQTNYTRIAIPTWLFVALYSFQPHKEARFIIYAVPPMTAAAALSANWIWTRRSKNILYRLFSLVALASIPLSLLAASGMLVVSSLSYPGGVALSMLKGRLREANIHDSAKVHVDVLSCMTGITLFEMDRPTLPLSLFFTNMYGGPQMQYLTSKDEPVQYSKEEDPEKLLDPKYWASIDYAVVENPAVLIGKWELVDTVYSFDRMELLRPETGLSESQLKENMETFIPALREEDENGQGLWRTHPWVLESGVDGIAREVLRRWLTGGWWYGPKLEAKLHIMKRVSPGEGYIAPVEA